MCFKKATKDSSQQSNVDRSPRHNPTFTIHVVYSICRFTVIPYQVNLHITDKHKSTFSRKVWYYPLQHCEKEHLSTELSCVTPARSLFFICSSISTPLAYISCSPPSSTTWTRSHTCTHLHNLLCQFYVRNFCTVVCNCFSKISSLKFYLHLFQAWGILVRVFRDTQ